MKPVSLRDYYECKRCYGASSMDFASLTDFYLPLIGTDAYSAYLALTRVDEGTFVHEALFNYLGLTPGEFESALTALEAVGLVRTFISSVEGSSLFVYCLYAPLHAAEFNSDIMLSGTLKGKLGEEAYGRLLSRHQGASAMTDLEEVSASFPSYFKKTYDAKFYLSVNNDHKDAGKAKAQTGFDRANFLSRLSAAGLRKNILSEEELVFCEKTATLYSVSEELMAEIVFDSILANQRLGQKLDRNLVITSASSAAPFGYLRQEKARPSEISSNSILAQKARMMDECPPAKFLSYVQGGHRPASSDLKLIGRLGAEIGLASPCINALVDYVLDKNDNVLSAAYCEKLAAAMVRAGCRSARDAMDFLKRRNKRKKVLAEEEPEMAEETPNVDTPATEGKKRRSKEELDAALAELFKE